MTIHYPNTIGCLFMCQNVKGVGVKVIRVILLLAAPSYVYLNVTPCTL